MFNNVEKLIPFKINAEANEFVNEVDKFMKNFYNSRKSKYTSPLARLRLIFATRELVDKHLNPKKANVYLKAPEFIREDNFFLSPIEFLKDRGILPHKVLANIPENDIGKFVELLSEELNKLEEDYIRLNHREETEK